MRKVLFILSFFVGAIAFAQGDLSGVIKDKDFDNEPLPFADVVVKGTTKGATTDFDGKFFISGIEAGTYTVQVTFVGYETKQIPNVVITDGQVTTIEESIGATAATLGEVVVTATSAVKESEKALLIDQKKATVIKESIGSQQMAKLAVSDAGAATAKISGVTKNESTGDIYVRGLGDRYLSTTLNGLPIPSDDVENKNINLSLFPSNVIQNIGISKTYSSDKYADQASGNVNINLKEHSGKPKFSISLTSGVNTNAIDGGFRRTQNKNNTTLGYYSSDLTNKEALTQEGWNTTREKNPVNFGISASAGAKLLDNKLSVFASASHSVSHLDQIGVFKRSDQNFVVDSISDAETFKTRVITSALLNTSYKIASGHKVKLSTVYINNLNDQVNEFGRNGEGLFEDETDTGVGSQFARDQNTKQTTLMITQLLGSHSLTEKDNIKWGLGYNFVDAVEPNRIRNEVNILGENDIRFGTQGATQQRKSAQIIQDREWNGYLNYRKTIIDDEEENLLKINVGANYRNKQRQFDSKVESFDLNERDFSNFSVSSFDNLNEGLNLNNVTLGVFEIPENGQTDLYDAELFVYAGNVNVDFNFGKFSGNVGVRYEVDEINLPQWDVTNPNPDDPTSLFSEYDNIFPSLNVKYEASEKSALRFAASKTITLPEFKELAPFEYTNPNGTQIQGNPNLIASTNYNMDIKFEFFPTSKELISLTAFGKIIEDPINRTLARGAAGNLSFFNTSEKAEILGLEFEAKKDILDTDKFNLNGLVNVTGMWHEQDLKPANTETGQNEEFRYGNKTKIGLQGASDWIVNAAISFSNKKENEFIATLSGNYSSDKVFALGNARNTTNFEKQFNNEIIEEDFVTLDLILSQELTKNLKLTAIGRNLLNPNIKRTQLIENFNTNTSIKETVLSYRKGLGLNVKLSYVF